MKNVIGMFVGLLALSGVAHAQSAGVGGGGFTEPEMKGFMNILSDYFATKDHSVLFPEVLQWEQKNSARMSEFIKTIEPKVVNHPVYFPAGVERDCVSYIRTAAPKPIQRWFECNAARIPESKLENQPKLYALLAHEIFVQAGIEKAGDANVPSTYESSSKFLDKRNLTLETIQRYIPGAAKPVASAPIQNNIILQIEANDPRDEGKIRKLLKDEHCPAPHPVTLEIILNQPQLWPAGKNSFGVQFSKTLSRNWVTLYYQGESVDSAVYPRHYTESAKGIAAQAKALLEKHCR